MHNKNHPIRRRHAGSGFFRLTAKEIEKLRKKREKEYNEKVKEK